MSTPRIRFASLAASALLSLALVAVACTTGQPDGEPAGETPDFGQRVHLDGGAYTDISAPELKSMLEDKDFPLVNVHVPYDGEIEGTDLFIPYDQIAQRLDELPASRSSKVVLYCRSGSMSAVAAEALVESGYTNVWNLSGGMNGWREAGYPLLNAGG